MIPNETGKGEGLMNAIMSPYQQAEAEKGYKQEWEASADIRAEFGDNYEAYTGFRIAQDKGLLPSDPLRRRFTLAQLEEHIRLSWDTNHDLRQRFANFDAYRSRRYFEEVLGLEQ
jgi:hypothetical protein